MLSRTLSPVLFTKLGLSNDLSTELVCGREGFTDFNLRRKISGMIPFTTRINDRG